MVVVDDDDFFLPLPQHAVPKCNEILETLKLKKWGMTSLLSEWKYAVCLWGERESWKLKVQERNGSEQGAIQQSCRLCGARNENMCWRNQSRTSFWETCRKRFAFYVLAVVLFPFVWLVSVFCQRIQFVCSQHECARLPLSNHSHNAPVFPCSHSHWSKLDIGDDLFD